MTESGGRSSDAVWVDVLIVTAVKEEYDAALLVDTGALAGSLWEKQPGPTGLEIAFRTFLARDGSPIRVALTRTLKMGVTATANAAAPLIKTYNPRCLAMCGVCAGRKSDVQLGDVIIASELLTYDTGASVVTIRKKDGRTRQVKRFKAEPSTYNLEAKWHQAAESFWPDGTEIWLKDRPRSYEDQSDWLLARLLAGEDPCRHPEWRVRCADFATLVQALRKRRWLKVRGLQLTAAGRAHIKDKEMLYPAGLPEPKPFAIHVGPIGTGTALVRDPDIFDRLSRRVRKVIGLEMEAAAIGAIAHLHGVERMIVMKGVMDHADPEKADNFKRFAARASAECLIAFLRAHLRPFSPDVSNVLGPGAGLEHVVAGGSPREPEEHSKSRVATAHTTSNAGSKDRKRLLLFNDILLLLERHELLFASYKVAREGGFAIAGSIGSIAVGLMSYEGMYADYFPGPSTVYKGGQSSEGVVEVAVGIHPSGEIVIGFTWISDVDDGWLERLTPFLNYVRSHGGTVREYYLDHPHLERHDVEPVSIRAMLNRIIGPSLQRHAIDCLALWSDDDERRLHCDPLFVLQADHTNHALNVVPESRTNKRVILLGTSGSSRSTLMRRCAATLAKDYLQDPEHASAPLLARLAGETPDWNLLLWKYFPESPRDLLRLAIGCDMVVPLLNGIEDLSLNHSSSIGLRSFLDESFGGPYSRIVASSSTAFYKTMCDRGVFPMPDDGLHSILRIR